MGAVAAAAAATLYRYAPNRDEAKWVWLTPGSVLATVLWLIVTIGFGLYVADFGSYHATYGSLGAAIVLLTWLYFSAYILLLGAELNCELERQTARDTTEGRETPLGQRGAYRGGYIGRLGGRGRVEARREAAIPGRYGRGSKRGIGRALCAAGLCRCSGHGACGAHRRHRQSRHVADILATGGLVLLRHRDKASAGIIPARAWRRPELVERGGRQLEPSKVFRWRRGRPKERLR